MNNNKIDFPREIAIKALYEINHKEAYINITISQLLKDDRLSQQDKSFIHQLVYGVIKNRGYIDWIISKYSNIKIKKISPIIKEILRIGIFQLFFLDRVPEFAAINESVQLSKKYSKGKLDRYTNAVLRNVLRDKEKIQSITFDNRDKLIISYSTPEWLVDYLLKQYTFEEVEDYIYKSLEIAPLSVRVNTNKNTKEELEKSLNDEVIAYRQGNIYYDALILSGINDITNSTAYRRGQFIIQDEAAMIAVDILDPKPGDLVLDMCSAPGGKTTHIGERLQNKSGLISRDIYDHKIKLIHDNCNRLGLTNINIQKKNGLDFSQDEMDKYDKILLDAPCSGLGIIRRKPDIKYKLQLEDISNIIKIQKELIENAYKYLKKGGYLVYCTCTINKKENQEIIDYLFNGYPRAKLVPIPKKYADIASKDFIQTFPDTGKFDGFFICKIQK